MTAYNATPTAELVELLIECRQKGIADELHGYGVTVALWEPPLDRFERKATGRVIDPSTAVVTMSAALYVRLYPNGHCGPTIVDQVSP